jgi:hypothetical protein
MADEPTPDRDAILSLQSLPFLIGVEQNHGGGPKRRRQQEIVGAPQFGRVGFVNHDLGLPAPKYQAQQGQ